MRNDALSREIKIGNEITYSRGSGIDRFFFKIGSRFV